MEPESLAALLNRHLDQMGWTITEAAVMAGLSDRQLRRLLHGDSRDVQRRTIEKLTRLGIDRRAVALAAYGEPATAI